MKAQKIVGSVLVAGLLGAIAFAACSGHTPARGPAPTSSATAAPETTSVASATAAPATGGTNADAGSSPQERLAADAKAARSCEAPLANITSHPDGGTIFNNALTSADAGSTDRARGVIDVLGAQAQQFRCCFNALVTSKPAEEAKLMLQVTLSPDGSVADAVVDPKRSNVDDALTIACVVGVARDASYPESPVGKVTLVEYPFRVVAQPK